MIQRFRQHYKWKLKYIILKLGAVSRITSDTLKMLWSITGSACISQQVDKVQQYTYIQIWQAKLTGSIFDRSALFFEVVQLFLRINVIRCSWRESRYIIQPMAYRYDIVFEFRNMLTDCIWLSVNSSSSAFVNRSQHRSYGTFASNMDRFRELQLIKHGKPA